MGVKFANGVRINQFTQLFLKIPNENKIMWIWSGVEQTPEPCLDPPLHIYVSINLLPHLIWPSRRTVGVTWEVRTIAFNKWAVTWQNQQNEYAPSEDSDQSGHPPSLISYWADAQAGLSLRWAHTHFVGFVMSGSLMALWCYPIVTMPNF